jgi:maltose alpha-D-glucosyltransferase/alpha-amylase
MRGTAGRVLRLLRQRRTQLSNTDGALAARIVEDRPGMLKIFSCLLEHRFAATKTRVHGDLHLGQLLNTGKDFVFIDFEGEAGRPIGERSLKRCPLVDLAAMIRSLDYAAGEALRRAGEVHRETLRPWAAIWVRTITQILVDEYFAACDGATFIPAAPHERAALLKAYVLDRALRELRRELTRGSNSAGVPLAAVAETLAVPAGEAAIQIAPSPGARPA